MFAKFLSGSVSAVVVVLAARTLMAQTPPSGIEGTPRSPAGWPAVAEKKSQEAGAITSDVLALAHYSNDLAIELGKLAEERGASIRVRRYGTLLVADHERADRALLGYARRQPGLTVESTSLAGDERPEAQQNMRARQQLRTLSGPAFDQAVLVRVLADHQQALADLRDYRQMVADPELRALFGKIAPILRQHVTIAERLQTSERGVGR